MPTRIKHQAIPLYSPSETIFNEKTSREQWHEDYFPLVTIDDTSQIVIGSDVYLEDVGVDPNFNFSTVGTMTAFTGGSPIVTDATATFITDGVKPGMFFMPYDGTTSADTTTTAKKILSVDSETQLTLVGVYLGGVGDYYEVSNWEYKGDIRTVNGFAEFDDTSATPLTSSFLKTQIKEDTVYKVEFSITLIDPDLPASKMRVRLGTNDVLTVFAEDIEAKDYVAFGVSNGTDLQIVLEGEPRLNIDNIVISEMYHTTYEIKDCETDSTKYDSILSDFTYSQSINQLRMNIQWLNAVSGYENTGCFYIDVHQQPDPNEYLERLNNGDFATADDWTFGTDWAFGSNSGLINSAGSAGNLSQTNLAFNFTKGVSYTIEYDVTVYAYGDVTMSLLSNGVEVFSGAVISAGGTVSVDTGILTDNCDEIRFTPNVGAAKYGIDNVTALKNTTDVFYDYRTDCFNMIQDLSNTVKLSGTNFDNAFGIDFEGLIYSPFIRVHGELETPTWDGEKENEEDSLGISKTLYFKSETRRELFLYQLPEFHHDFVRLLIGYDKFLVDDVEYISKDSSYEPEVQRSLGKISDLSNSTTKIRQKNDLNVNKFC